VDISLRTASEERDNQQQKEARRHTITIAAIFLLSIRQ
jgi:hypothetical protein